MTRLRHQVAALLTIHAGLLCAAGAHAGSWQNSAPFGATLKGDLYTPTTPAASPAILVVIHMCTGHSSTVHGWFDSFADQHGFYLIAPDAGKQCFDSSASRDGDKAAIVKMVDYVVTNKNADKSRVFAAGMSSGGCMTNTLLAIYPDVFVGGSAMPGFPAGGWPANDTTCTKCGSTPPSTDGKYWGDIARKAFAWNGSYPCSQQWVGGGDEYNFNGWLPAVAAQFQNLGSLGAASTGTGAPSGWTRSVYKDNAGNVRLETNLGPASQKHDLENLGATLYGNVVTFLGLDKTTGACGLAPTGSGGASSSGGSGGTSSIGGASNLGGSLNSGGTPSGNGGAASIAGANSSLAGSSAAGAPSAGDSAGTSSGLAGSSPLDQAGGPASAGAPSSSAGSTSNGGSGSDSGGCSLSSARHSTSGRSASLLAMGVAALFVRRRARR